ncbi:MAG: hypothetical protein Q8K66_13165 [Sediminibacterium sp.]|nr:hypothetical protein [Sediminibacterium sp.]MDP3128815.1 hypothetical protein [Sediminibacterium sp.]
MGQLEQPIDLQKLSQRELLILVYTKVEALEKTSVQQTEKQIGTDIQLAVIKTKMQIWAAAIGFATGLLGSIIILVIAKVIEK